MNSSSTLLGPFYTLSFDFHNNLTGFISIIPTAQRMKPGLTEVKSSWLPDLLHTGLWRWSVSPHLQNDGKNIHPAGYLTRVNEVVYVNTRHSAGHIVNKSITLFFSKPSSSFYSMRVKLHPCMAYRAYTIWKPPLHPLTFLPTLLGLP